jgi:hypothetical protein
MKIKICTITLEPKYKHIFADEIFKDVQVIRRNLYSATHRKLFIYLQTATFCAQNCALHPTFSDSPIT